MDDQAILKKTEGRVLTLILNRPKAFNAFNLELAEALGAALQEAAADENVRVVILRGGGKAFSAGGDIKMFHKDLEAGSSEFRRVFPLLNDAIRAIRNLPKPVIAAVQGPAYAAGFGLALSCDLVVASHGSKLSPSFLNIGLAPNASSTFFLPRLIGWRRATEAFMRAEVFSATEALALGIVNHVWSESAFDSEVKSLAEDLAGRPAGALARIKHLMNESASRPWQEQIELEKEEIALSSLSPEFQEGVSAFFEKRRPKY